MLSRIPTPRTILVLTRTGARPILVDRNCDQDYPTTGIPGPVHDREEGKVAPAMALIPGSQVGPYEMLRLIGSGGMGEVYRARDSRLGRDVAVKVLPAEFADHPERVRRFEQEARAVAALNHPNILSIYDVGEREGSPYLVTELLEGASLRETLAEGSLSVRKVIEIGAQVAEGLAAAHEKGIVHRDLKPGNIFATDDGRAKILDFGLARLVHSEGDSVPDSRAPTAEQGTKPGTLLGTMGYMSPEQVKGRPADARSDIFSLGVVLYEMLSGRRPFAGESEAEVMTAILKDAPPPLSAEGLAIPPMLDRTVAHCLEKNPDRRFQSARDIVFALESVSSGSSISVALPPLPEETRKRRLRWALATLAVLALIGGGAFSGVLWGKRVYDQPFPSYKQLTFRRGMITSARFSPDGNTVYYSAAWGGKPLEIFAKRLDTVESQPLGIRNAQVLAVSSGEMALLIKASPSMWGYRVASTLARVPLGGGTPREIAEDVYCADYAPGTTDLAIARKPGSKRLQETTGGKTRLEYPIGNLLYESEGNIACARFDPSGKWIAFFDLIDVSSSRGDLAIVDLKGHKSVLTNGWVGLNGLAWRPDGTAVLFTGSKTSLVSSLYSVDLEGHVRLESRTSGSQVLDDVSQDGRMIFSRPSLVTENYGLLHGGTQERDLSWMGSTSVWYVSEDGEKVVFYELGPGKRTVYLMEADASWPVRLGEGVCGWLSPDGKWSLVLQSQTLGYELMPTGAGEAVQLLKGTLQIFSGGRWFPTGNRILIGAKEAGRPLRLWIQDVPDGLPRPLAPEGCFAVYGAISPDGRYVAAVPPSQEAVYLQFPVAGGEPIPIPGIRPGEIPITYSDDGRFLYVREHDVGVSAPICKLDLRTGRREPWRTLRPHDPSGVISIDRINVTMNGRYYSYDYARSLSELFLAEGLR